MVVARRGRPAASAMVAIALATAALLVPHQVVPTARATNPGTLGKIAFSAAIDRADEDVYVANLDGTGVTRITTQVPPSGLLRADDPQWSPDGTRIALSMNADGTQSIWTMDPDGSNPTDVTPGTFGRYPSWSPDGTHIVFAATWEAGTTGAGNLFIVDSNGQNLHQLTTGGHIDQDPAWSPTTGRIAFVRDGALTLVDSSGANLTTLNTGLSEIYGPNWSPDGQALVFAASNYSQGYLYRIHADGTGLVMLTTYNVGAYPAFSPDGQRIGFLYAGIMTASVTGTCGAQVVPLPASQVLGKIAWQPVPAGALRLQATTDCVADPRGSKATYTINLLRSGMSAPVTLSVGALPPGTSATFSSAVTSGTSATLTLTPTECPNGTPYSPVGQAYTIPVTASGGGYSATTYVELHVLDGPPVMTQYPTETLTAPATIGSGIGVRTKWQACDQDPGFYYQWWRQTGTTWSGPSGCCLPTTSILQTLTFGTTYRYRVKVYEGDLSTALKYGPSFEPLLTQQTSTAVHWGGSWATAYGSAYSGGSSRYASGAGSWASFSFTGASVGWVTALGPTRGSAKVYIDGVYRATVSLNSGSSSYRRVMYVFNWPSQGSHTIKVVVVGTSGHARVDVDGFVRLYRT